MPTLQYNENMGEVGQGFRAIGNSLSNAALGLAVARQRDEQQRMMNMLRMMEMQKELRTEAIREKLFGAQIKEAEARTGQANERTKQLEGLNKIIGGAEDVYAQTFAEEMARSGVPALDPSTGMGYGPATGGMLPASQENLSAVANAVRRAQLERSVASNPAASARRLAPFNVGQHGTIDPFGRELAGARPAEPEIVTAPYGSGIFRVPAEGTMETLREPVVKPSVNTEHPSAIVRRYSLALESAVDSGMQEDDPEAFKELNREFIDSILAARKARSGGTNAPLGGVSGKYKILEVK